MYLHDACKSPRRAFSSFAKCIGAAGLTFALAGLAPAQVDWIKRGFDDNRTGANVNESTLNIANVNRGQFGKLFTRTVDGQIYGQPLVVTGVMINGKSRNVVYVVTMHDSVYAFDADDPTARNPLWKLAIVDPKKGVSAIPYQNLTGFTDIHPEVGILSTPAIDKSTNTMYFVARTLEGNGDVDANYHQKLCAIDIRTGLPTKPPLELTASVRGTGDGSVNGVITYNPRRQNQRPALVLNKGKLYIASASHGDNGPYHGWILCYDVATMRRLGAFCSTPNAGLGGFWMAGHAMPIDADGNIYAVTGNGNFNPAAGNYGDSVLKLNGTTLAVMDSFTPYNQAALDAYDADLGSCGPILIPDTDLVVAGSKEGKLYVMNRKKMGGYNSQTDNHIVQWWYAGNGHIHGTPAFWSNRLYMWSENDKLKAFLFSNGHFVNVAGATSTVQAPPGMPGGFITVSAKGTDQTTGIVWATVPFLGDANWNTVPGVLRAFRATDLKELWNSRMADEDDFGNFAKFNPPVVVNGKVYVATFSNQLAVYGLLPAVPPLAPNALTAEGGNHEVALTWGQRAGTTSYEVRRSASGGAFVKVAEVTGVGYFVDKTAVNGTPYVYQVDGKNGYGVSDLSNPVSATPVVTTVTPGTGTIANYFNDPGDGTHFVTPALTRTESTIDNDWGNGSPNGVVQTDNFSVTWGSYLTVPTTGYYTFQTVSDDGVRLWLKGKLAIDNWTDHGPASDFTTPILLMAGNKYPFQMEMYERGGGAVSRLWWTGPGITNYQPVPATAMYPIVAPYPDGDGMLDLSDQFNLDGMSYRTNTLDGDFTGQGQTLSAELIPDTTSKLIGTSTVTLKFGPRANGLKNAIACDGRTIPVPAASANTVYIAGASTSDTQTGTFTLNYSDGTTSTVSVNFTDWGAPAPRNNETLLLRFDRRYASTGAVITPTSIYAYALPADSKRRLVSVKLPDNSIIKLLSITVQR